ncbi:MAG: histidine phosphatase family protein [Rhizobiales bacterium]|nr:histidine phosphatase family protein [Hyphomicrobiales bacterium]
MSQTLPVVYLARHGETAWSQSGRHTGLTDIPLTERGERMAVALGKRLKGMSFATVLSSPLQRAHRTCELTGLAAGAKIDPDLVEWNYGQYEGLTSAEIHGKAPQWNLFRDGCPQGESPEAISARADRVVARLRGLPGPTLLFSSGHIIRVLAARWLGLTIEVMAARFLLDTASLSALSYEHTVAAPAIRLWNDIRHLDDVS